MSSCCPSCGCLYVIADMFSCRKKPNQTKNCDNSSCNLSFSSFSESLLKDQFKYSVLLLLFTDTVRYFVYWNSFCHCSSNSPINCFKEHWIFHSLRIISAKQKSYLNESKLTRLKHVLNWYFIRAFLCCSICKLNLQQFYNNINSPESFRINQYGCGSLSSDTFSIVIHFQGNDIRIQYYSYPRRSVHNSWLKTPAIK